MRKAEYKIKLFCAGKEEKWEMVKGLVSDHFGIKKDHGFYTVTHLKSGMAIMRNVSSLKKARELVEHLEQAEIPWDKDIETIQKYSQKALEVKRVVFG